MQLLHSFFVILQKNKDKTIYMVETSRKTMQSMLLPRDVNAHKGSMGHALLVSGSYGMAGAAVLAAKACLRSGVGKCTVHTPSRNNDIIQISVPEAIVSLDGNERVVADALNATFYDSLGIGPGLGTSPETTEVVLRMVSTTTVPTVVDADAINILGKNRDVLKSVPDGLIFTPHLKELQKLCGDDNSRWNRNKAVEEALRLAVGIKGYVIVKGHRSVLCCPDGETFCNITGNAGMATAGSGDVLTGIITGLLARGYDRKHAAMLGMYLHGLAGDKAADALGMESVMAGDIVAHIPAAFMELQSGICW